ncbi:hypothetical protein Tco_1357516, partial [Tanacetum coccineum]
VPNKEKDITEEKVILEWGDEQDSEYSNDENDDNDDVKKDDKYGDADDEGDDYINDTQDANDEMIISVIHKMLIMQDCANMGTIRL